MSGFNALQSVNFVLIQGQTNLFSLNGFHSLTNLSIGAQIAVNIPAFGRSFAVLLLSLLLLF